MTFQRWMRKHNPCTGQEWEHCCISPAKHRRPDITNPVTELSKRMDGASMANVAEMYKVINFVLETKTLGLRMVPIFKDGIWKLEVLSDSDFANDKDTRYSVYGYIIYFCGVPVVWKSKSMKSVVMSTTEAEYVAVSEVVKEIKFLYQMLRSMEIKVPLPIKVQVDNVGVIYGWQIIVVCQRGQSMLI